MGDFGASLVNVLAMAGVFIGGYFSGILIKRCVSEMATRLCPFSDRPFFRNKRSRILGIFSAWAMSLVYLLIFLRWRVGCQLWEAIYLLLFGLTLGALFSTQFIEMSSTLLKEQLGQCMATYYLSQKLGTILGPIFGLKLIDQLFQQSLEHKLPSNSSKHKVRSPSWKEKFLD